VTNVIITNLEVLRYYHGEALFCLRPFCFEGMNTMSADAFAPIHDLINAIIGWSEALLAGMNNSWAEDQQKLADIVLASAQSASSRLVNMPAELEQVRVWKHDALSPLIAISSAVDILIEDFELVSRDDLLDYARKIHASSEQGRRLIVELAEPPRIPNS
jgi:hypothetical protein